SDQRLFMGSSLDHQAPFWRAVARRAPAWVRAKVRTSLGKTQRGLIAHPATAYRRRKLQPCTCTAGNGPPSKPKEVSMDRPNRRTLFLLLALMIPASAFAGDSRDEKWVATWSTSPQGPYPIGYTVGQPLMSYALPGDVAHEQSFRLIVHPSVWGESWRIRLSNNFGTAPIAIGHAYIGVQKTGSTLVPGT